MRKPIFGFGFWTAAKRSFFCALNANHLDPQNRSHIDMILSIRRNRGCSLGAFVDFRNSAAIPPARMVAIQPEMAINPATVRDIKTLESANETQDPASIHRYDGPVPLAARSDLVGSVCCQRLEVTWLCVRVTRSSGFGRSRHQLSSRSVPLTHMVERWPPGLVAQAHILSRRMD